MFHLKQRKLLLVIDDTDDVAQLNILLPLCKKHPEPRCKLHSESLVVITSRNRSVLTERCTSVMEVQLLPEGYDMQLFKAWAFSAGPPSWDMSALVVDVVDCCGRLPLTLKVGTVQYFY